MLSNIINTDVSNLESQSIEPIPENSKDSKIINLNINNSLKEKVYSVQDLKLDEIKIIEIRGDGNCFYRCLSYFFSGNTEYYEEIKQLIIKRIENNYEDYLDFYGDDDANNLQKEYFSKKELDYIKSKNSWGSHYTIAISFLLYNLDIALYVKENQNTFKRLNFFQQE